MTGPHDTDPPPPAPITSPELPEEPIAAGRARLAVELALATVTRDYLALSRSILNLDAIASGIARQLDATVQQGEAGSRREP